MKGLVVLVVIAALTFASLPARVEGNGWTCFYCTIITNTLFEYTLTHGNDMGQALEQVAIHSSPPPLLLPPLRLLSFPLFISVGTSPPDNTRAGVLPVPAGVPAHVRGHRLRSRPHHPQLLRGRFNSRTCGATPVFVFAKDKPLRSLSLIFLLILFFLKNIYYAGRGVHQWVAYLRQARVCSLPPEQRLLFSLRSR